MLKRNQRTFILDKIKGWIMLAILGGGILAFIIWFYQETGEDFWLYAWSIVTAFTVFMNMFYARLIVPLFNKQTPLEVGELREKTFELIGLYEKCPVYRNSRETIPDHRQMGQSPDGRCRCQRSVSFPF